MLIPACKMDCFCRSATVKKNSRLSSVSTQMSLIAILWVSHLIQSANLVRTDFLRLRISSSLEPWYPYVVDPGPQDLCVVAAMDKFTRTTEILWRKRDGMATLWVRKRVRGPESARPLPGQAFIAFLGTLHRRMVLIYYAQVHCKWLPFTDNKGKNAANYFKEKDVIDQGGKWLNWLHSRLGRFSTDFRKLKILSKHLLPQFRVREF